MKIGSLVSVIFGGITYEEQLEYCTVVATWKNHKRKIITVDVLKPDGKIKNVISSRCKVISEI